ncbi:BCCT family transporter [Roseobacter sp. WL0113]|uniref:BCCT family transporter n=1 Tax=Roseobacter sinensis TaxID=2931391 RepID=A0ABT3BDJ2_9RHOB|nr:BCCT family transporter [Roseobacter sp. WL0113]
MILWIVIRPDHAVSALSGGKDFTLGFFRAWFIYAVGGFVVFCLCVGALPISGRIILGSDDERPEHSTAAWLAMIFCAGIGAGALIYSVSEPLSHLTVNPSVIDGSMEANTVANASRALSYTYLHWGLSAWACYTVLGLAMAFFSYRHGMPLTIRSALGPALGKFYDGPIGDVIDVFSIFAIIVGIATTLGYGMGQLVYGVHSITQLPFFICEGERPDLIWQLVGLALVGVTATVSAMRGGIKWLSVLGAWLFLAVLVCFSLAGQSGDSLVRLGGSLWSYIGGLPINATRVSAPDGSELGQILATWQTDWTIFYWAWWIAFAPFVALFLARISRGRSLRSFVFGCMLAPVGVCVIWFAFVGGAALDVQLDPEATVDLQGVVASAQIYETIRAIARPGFATYWSAMFVALLTLLMITTLNAGILAINSIAAAGAETRSVPVHVLTWGFAVTTMIGSLIFAGGTDAVRNAMIVGALPFSFVIALSGICVALSLMMELRRRWHADRQGG